MRVPIILPALGANDETLSLCSWLFDEGDLIVAGDLVAEVSIPGITCEIVAESTGRLVEIVKPADSKVHSGDTLGWLEDGLFEPDVIPSVDNL